MLTVGILVRIKKLVGSKMICEAGFIIILDKAGVLIFI